MPTRVRFVPDRARTRPRSITRGLSHAGRHDPDQRLEDHRRGSDLPAAPAGEGAVRQRPGRPDRPGLDRRRHHRVRRGRLRPPGGQGRDRGAVLAHDRHRAGPPPDRRGPVPDRIPLAQDVPGQHLRRAPGDRHPRHERHRPGALGHQGQGAGPPRLEAARRRVRQDVTPLCQLPLRRDARRDRRAGPSLRRAGLHRRQVRLGPDGDGRQDRRRPRARGPQRPRPRRSTS